ncbi:Transmembrane protein [Quillaja saponaria]|uniref:Transmembrane protein n=1 Tax=Quillaja saponaria TaxID=32244 RepID=A0AAD7PKI8_QUISA|nr:Transmembrane protein [Quillaja saponaria]
MSPSGDESTVADGNCPCFSGNSGGFYDDGYGESADLNCTHCGSGRSDPHPSSSCTSSESIPLKDWEKLRRIIIASAKGFTIGAGLKGGLALFSVLIRLKRRNALTSPRKEGVVTNTEAIVLAVKETLRYGLFLGTFAGTFVSMDEIIGALGGHRRTARWRALLAGAIAGPSMLLTGFETQHTSLAIYILMRAAVLASRCGIKSRRFGKFCKPLTWTHGDIFLMCLSSSQILSAYILKQESLPPSYKSFLNKHGGKDPVILQGVKDVASGMPFTNLEAIENYYNAMGVNVNLDPQMKIPCSIVHGNQSCGAHVLSFLYQAYKRALPVYLPVYLIPALLVHRKGLLERPGTILAKGLLGTARSSLFLSVYCSSAWMWTCMLFRIFKRCNIPMLAMGTFPTGLALAIEKKSRRTEISLYCLARALESFFTCMADTGYLPPSKKLKRADVLIFSLSTAIIMHCYAQEREVFRSKYLNVLDWVFGVPPPPCETPRCKNS